MRLQSLKQIRRWKMKILDNYEDNIKYINFLIEKKGTTINQVANGTGLAFNTIKKMLKGETDISLRNYIKIFKFLEGKR